MIIIDVTGMKNRLWALVLMTGLTLSQAAAAQEPVSVITIHSASHSWEGTPLPAYPPGQPQITMARVIIEPGAMLPVHLHHQTITAGVLLRGSLRVVTDSGESLVLEAGDAIIETQDTWHHGENPGSETAELLVFYAGVEGQPLSVQRTD